MYFLNKIKISPSNVIFTANDLQCIFKKLYKCFDCTYLNPEALNVISQG